MFSGIVSRLGVVVAREPCDFGQRLAVEAGGWDYHPAPGDSIAVNGCCLTFTGSSGGGAGTLGFDVVRQTIETTTLGGLRPGDAVNLEHAVTPETLLGGHLVQGHVDGVGEVGRVTADATERRLRIEPPADLREFIIDKGSIAVDGVSLTVAGVEDEWFEVALIPTTIERTTLGGLAKGGRVNLETDCVVKTVVSWLKRQQA